MLEFKVTGMSCAHCTATITAAIHRHDPSAAVAVDLAAGRVRISSTTNPTVLLKIIGDLGYEAELLQALT